MRIQRQDLAYALAHPLQAVRYLRHRDGISYAECGRHLPPAPVIVEAGAFDGSNTRELPWLDLQGLDLDALPALLPPRWQRAFRAHPMTSVAAAASKRSCRVRAGIDSP